MFRGCDWEREAGEVASNSRSILFLATNRLDHNEQCSSSMLYSNPRVRAESSSAESARFELCKPLNGSRASVPGNNDVGPSCKPSEWESVTALQRQSAPCHDRAYTRLRALTFPTQTMLRQGGAGRTRRFLLNWTTLSNPAYSSDTFVALCPALQYVCAHKQRSVVAGCVCAPSTPRRPSPGSRYQR